MLLAALSFLAGVLLLIPAAPSGAFWLALPVCLVAVAVRRLHDAIFRRIAWSCLVAAAGFLWGSWHALQYLEQRLPESLAGVDLLVTGTIDSIPDRYAHVQRFVFDVEQIGAVDGQADPQQRMPSRLKLSWYDAGSVRAGERWRFTVRLKPPHGFMNPGGFDYEGWLYQHRIHASGYVRSSENNRQLASASVFSIHRWRERIAERIGAYREDLRFEGMLQALAVGERSAISTSDWKVLIRTGTIHLMAISGLHIGLAAAFGYGLVMLISTRLLPSRWLLLVPAPSAAVCGAMLAAGCYAMLAGFSIPTQRALIMLTVVSLAFLLRRHTRPADTLSAALLFVLLYDPVAVLAPGFWFSFLAVAAIFYCAGRYRERSLWFRAAWVQLVLSIALLPVSIGLFQQGSLIAPVANLVLVPWVSFLVVPPVLLAMLVMPVSATLAEGVLRLADLLLGMIWPVIEALSTLPYAIYIQPGPGPAASALALAAVVLAFRRHATRWLAPLLVLPAVLWRVVPVEAGGYRVAVLDVGQGLAVAVQTRSHSLLYDAGARFGERLDSGSAVIVPYLRQQGIRTLDRMVISHGDNDHIGGARAVLQAYPGTPLTGRQIDPLTHDVDRCLAGERWRWDGVEFEFLHPENAMDAGESNNLSCVLRISGPGGVTLLTGDIEESVERRLLYAQDTDLDADVMLVPHHGSLTSSSEAFIRAVSPEIAIIPSGYRNRYGFPRPEVVARYRQTGARLHNTADAGMVRFEVTPSLGIGAVQRYRDDASRYWHHRPPRR